MVGWLLLLLLLLCASVERMVGRYEWTSKTKIVIMRIGIQQRQKQTKKGKQKLSRITCLGYTYISCLFFVSALLFFVSRCKKVASREHISIEDATDTITNDDDATAASQNNHKERLDVTKGSKRLPTSTGAAASSSSSTTAAAAATKLKKNPNAPKRFKR